MRRMALGFKEIFIKNRIRRIFVRDTSYSKLLNRVVIIKKISIRRIFARDAPYRSYQHITTTAEHAERRKIKIKTKIYKIYTCKNIQCNLT